MGSLPRISHAETLRDLTRSSVLLGSLHTTELACLVGIGHGARLGRGRTLLHGTEDAATVVLDGVVATRTVSNNGGDHLTGLHSRGETLGLTVVLGHPDTARQSVALTQVDALVIPGHPLRRLIAEEPRVGRACLRTLAAQLASSQRLEDRFADTSTGERVMLRLLELSDRFGEPRPDGAVSIQLPLTQEDLASWARTSRESTARQLQQLRNAGIIATGRRDLTVLDPDALLQRVSPHGVDPVINRLLRHIG